MPGENNPPPTEIPASPVQTENQPPPAEVQAAPPPAAALVVNGVKSEREIELEQQLADTSGNLTKAERRALEAERRAAELERDNQELKKIPRVAKPTKEKPWYSVLISNEEN